MTYILFLHMKYRSLKPLNGPLGREEPDFEIGARSVA